MTHKRKNPRRYDDREIALPAPEPEPAPAPSCTCVASGVRMCPTHGKCAHGVLGRCRPCIKAFWEFREKSKAAAFISWPAYVPARYNACTDPCDTWTGACACGATHENGI